MLLSSSSEIEWSLFTSDVRKALCAAPFKLSTAADSFVRNCAITCSSSRAKRLGALEELEASEMGGPACLEGSGGLKMG
jgi:hypothetical protein